MDALHWVLTICLGLGLAASTGFNVTLPLLVLATLAHFHVGGIVLRHDFAWLSSDTALVSLGIAAVIEFLADKVPGLDHAVHAISVVAGPAAGAIAAASLQTHSDPGVAILLGLVLGGTTSLGFTSAAASLRVASSALTLGIANPILSFLEDGTAVTLIVIALVAPLLIPATLAILIIVIWKVAKAVKSRLGLKKAAAN